MPEQNDLNPTHPAQPMHPAHRQLEAAFKSLRPTPAHLDPIAAAFTAGRRSARPQLQLWRAAAAIILIVSVAASLLPRPRPTAILPTLAQAGAPAAQPLSSQSLFVLHQSVRDRGLDGLPATKLPPIPNFQARDLF